MTYDDYFLTAEGPDDGFGTDVSVGSDTDSNDSSDDEEDES